MKKTVAKLTLGLTSTAILATVGAQLLHDSYVVQDGIHFCIAAASSMDPYVLAANNGKSILTPSTQVMYKSAASQASYSCNAPAYDN